MFEKLKVAYSVYLEIGAETQLLIEVKNDKLYYSYFDGNELDINVQDNIKFEGVIEDFSEFEKGIESLNVYSFKKEHSSDEIFTLDGFSYTVEYKESGKRTKKMYGSNYYTDEIYALFEQIEILLPEITLAGEAEENAVEELKEYIKIYNYSLKGIEKLEEAFKNAKTKTAKRRIIDRAYENLYLDGELN